MQTNRKENKYLFIQPLPAVIRIKYRPGLPGFIMGSKRKELVQHSRNLCASLHSYINDFAIALFQGAKKRTFFKLVFNIQGKLNCVY